MVRILSRIMEARNSISKILCVKLNENGDKKSYLVKEFYGNILHNVVTLLVNWTCKHPHISP